MKKIYFLALCTLIGLGLSAQEVIWEDNFDDGDASDWSFLDMDGDGENWFVDYFGRNGTPCLNSASWNQAPLRPNNAAVTPLIDLTEESGTVTFNWFAYAQDQTWPFEKYKVVLTYGGTQEDIDNGIVLFEEILTATGDQVWVERSVDLTDYVGDLFLIAFVHYDVTDQFRMNIDDVSLVKPAGSDVGITAVTSPSNAGGCQLGTEEAVSVELFNFGGTPLTGFDISYQINGGPVVTETFTETIGVSSSATYTFAATEDLSALGEYSVEIMALLDDDSDGSNNTASTAVRTSDAVISVEVQTVVTGGHGWTITDNVTGEVIYQRGGYQWNVNETDDVCVYSDGCYSFSWSANENLVAGEYIQISLDGNVVFGDMNGTGIPMTFDVPSIGGACAAKDGSIPGLRVQPYGVVGESHVIAAELLNVGTETWNSVEASYSIDGGMPITETFDGLDVSSGNSFVAIFNENIMIEDFDDVNVQVEILNINGEADENAQNNTGNGTVVAIEYRPERGVLVEEATGTWCQWCPRGHVMMERLMDDFPAANLIAVHNDDPMADTDYDAALTGITGGGWPNGSVDRRANGIDPLDFETAVRILQDETSPIEVIVDAEILEDERMLNIEMVAKFLAPATGDYRMAVMVVENEVTGTTPDYAQVNAYAGGGAGAMGGYEFLPNPVPASDMVYENVLRQSPTGFAGQEGSIPSNDIARNDQFKGNWTVSLPEEYNLDHIYVIGVVLDATTGAILNSGRQDEGLVSADNIVLTENAVNVFPNPFQDFINVRITLKETADVRVNISDMMGQTIASREYSNFIGDQIIPYQTANLKAGMYLVSVETQGEIITKKVILAR